MGTIEKVLSFMSTLTPEQQIMFGELSSVPTPVNPGCWDVG